MSLKQRVDEILGGGMLDRVQFFRPILYLATWAATIIIIVKGDFASIPDELQDEAQGTFWVWGSLSLFATPLALLADYLLHKSPPCKYRAMWMRLGADLSQFVSILVYLLLRFYLGDYHVYSTAALMAALGYVTYLVFWDIAQLIGVERLAEKLERVDG